MADIARANHSCSAKQLTQPTAAALRERLCLYNHKQSLRNRALRTDLRTDLSGQISQNRSLRKVSQNRPLMCKLTPAERRPEVFKLPELDARLELIDRVGQEARRHAQRH